MENVQLNIKFNATTCPETFPAYCRYAGQAQAQPAYISLNLENGDLDVDYNAEISGIPNAIWHKRVLAFNVRPETTADNLAEIINDNAEMFQTILNNSDVEWNDLNYVGVLNDTARGLYNKFEYGFGFKEECYTTMIEDLGDYLENGDMLYPSDDQSMRDFAQEILNLDGENDQYFPDYLKSLDEMLSELCGIWANELYSGNDLPHLVAKYLLEVGTCNDSEWLEELKEFANNACNSQ